MERELVDAFLQVYGDDLISLVLFGSYARGEQRKDSDIDVLVVLRKMKARYAVIDTSIYNIPRADKYVAVLEPTDLRRIDVERLQRRGYFIVINKAGALSAWARGWIPFVREGRWRSS
ncbi:nucleotidyltransferase domain-containing protein [Pyrobaculum sp. 3827-6]|jgi:predicted nucleotidyltransferase|nr:nucleotidyltransferase domain-containing protein [Pyrobaculum sp. 3827-6]MCU7788874.1 nucleotidyltransferase domain-containing protein [Pyrobaculum sp. 3827-6]